MFNYICTCIVLYSLISIVWSDPRKKWLVDDSKRREARRAIAKLERQNLPASHPSLPPTFNSAERARVLALGRIRDGATRHPILDAPYVSVVNRRVPLS